MKVNKNLLIKLTIVPNLQGGVRQEGWLSQRRGKRGNDDTKYGHREEDQVLKTQLKSSEEKTDPELNLLAQDGYLTDRVLP